jgi:hypothetical protein
MRIGCSIAVLASALLFTALAGCEASNDPPATRAPNKFESTFAKPAWFDSIRATELNTEREVTTLWMSQKRCCENAGTLETNNRIFYKSCYNAISAHYEDEKLVVKCLWLMDIASNRDETVRLARFLVDNYSHHKNSVDFCADCMPGDTVGEVTLELARFDSRERNNKQLPISRLEKLLDTREDEISYWVQAEIYEFLGQLYLEDGLTQERLARYQKAYTRLERLKEINEPLKTRFAPLQKHHEAMLKIVATDVEKSR